MPFDPLDVGDWWGSVSKSFDPPGPPLQVVASAINEQPFVALVFDTAGRPYVVSVPDGGRYPFAVPWRDANRTRTATRAELVSLLVEKGSTPEIDVLEFEVRASKPETAKPQSWWLNLDGYVHQGPHDVLTFPNHRSDCSLDVPQYRLRFDKGGDISFPRPNDAFPYGDGVVEGPGRFSLRCEWELPIHPGIALPNHPPTQEVIATVSLRPANSPSSIIVQQSLPPTADPYHESTWAYWGTDLDDYQ